MEEWKELQDHDVEPDLSILEQQAGSRGYSVHCEISVALELLPPEDDGVPALPYIGISVLLFSLLDFPISFEDIRGMISEPVGLIGRHLSHGSTLMLSWIARFSKNTPAQSTMDSSGLWP